MIQNKLKFLQWNARSIRANQESLDKLIKDRKLDIILLSETWLKSSHNYLKAGFTVYREDRMDSIHGGGVAILVRNSIPNKKININCANINFEVVGIEITILNKKKISLISIYAPPGTIISQNNWLALTQQICGDFIICGDFNAHSPAWGCSFEDHAGKNILENIDLNSLGILNDGRNTMIGHPFRNTSPVDLTIASANLIPQLLWSLVDEPLGSDHFGILIELTYSSTKNNMYVHKRINTRNIDWASYNGSLNNLKFNSDITESSDYDSLIKSMETAASLSSPKTNLNTRYYRPSPVWWDPECTNVVKERKNLFKNFSKNINFENFIEYKKADSLTKRTLKYKKRTKWKEFCSKIDKNTPDSDIWKQIKIFKNIYSPSSGPNTDHIMEEFFDSIAPSTVATEINFLSGQNTARNSLLDSEFTYEEFLNAVNSKRDSAPGLDVISYSMIKNLPKTLKLKLLDFFNYFFENNTYPSSWSTHRVVMIPKPYKDHSLAMSYRPITLSSCVGKVFELILKNRFEWWVESSNQLCRSQFGFRRGKSTCDNLTILYNDIMSSFKYRGFTTAIFLDIKGAYDNVNLDILIKKLIKMQISHKIINYLLSTAHTRYIYLQNKNQQIGPRILTKGIGQGTILAPLLFSIYTQEIESCTTPGVKILQYADDVVIYTSSQSILTNENRLKDTLSNLNTILNNLGLSLELDKTKAVVFTRKYKYDIGTHISFDSNNIEILSRIKFLGVVLDSKLLWRNHMNFIKEKVEKKINMMKTITNTSWGSSPATCLLLYRSIIRPHFEYGCNLFDNASKSTLSILDKLQLRCTRICSGALMSSPSNALLVETKEMPLKLRRKWLSLNYLVKKISISDQLVINSFPQTDKKLAFLYNNIPKFKIFSKSPIFHYNYSNQIFKIPTWTLPYSKGTPNINSLFLNFIHSKFNDFLLIYTDGSKNLYFVGSALWCPSKEYSQVFKLPPETSIYSAECFAVLKALHYIKNVSEYTKYLICTDSLSILKAINGFPTNKTPSYLILEIIDEINKLGTQGRDIAMLWIPSHSGIIGNEEVDRLATSSVAEGIQYSLDLPPGEIRSMLKKLIYKEWQNMWSTTSAEKGRHFFGICPRIPVQPWFEKSKLCRKLIVHIIRLRIGHATTPAYLHRIGRRDNPYCLCDNVSYGDTSHALLGCELRRHKIDRLYIEIKKEIEFPTSVSALLASLSEGGILAESFIKHIISIGFEL